jgi:hypothetical protein
MNTAELEKMQKAGRVQEGTNGVTSITVPPNPAAYKNAPPGDVFVEFNVPSDSVRALTENGWAKIYGPNNFIGEYYGVSEMPEATEIKLVPFE